MGIGKGEKQTNQCDKGMKNSVYPSILGMKKGLR